MQKVRPWTQWQSSGFLLVCQGVGKEVQRHHLQTPSAGGGGGQSNICGRHTSEVSSYARALD